MDESRLRPFLTLGVQDSVSPLCSVLAPSLLLGVGSALPGGDSGFPSCGLEVGSSAHPLGGGERTARDWGFHRVQSGMEGPVLGRVHPWCLVRRRCIVSGGGSESACHVETRDGHQLSFRTPGSLPPFPSSGQDVRAEGHAWGLHLSFPFSLRTSFELLLVSECPWVHPVSIWGLKIQGSTGGPGSPWP